MPAYAWLNAASVEAIDVAARMKALRKVGVPYEDAAIDAASQSLKGKTEMDAVVAYLQILGWLTDAAHTPVAAVVR